MVVQIIIAVFGEFTQEIICRLYQELCQIMKKRKAKHLHSAQSLLRREVEGYHQKETAY